MAVGPDLLGNLRDLLRGFPLAKDHFGETFAGHPVVVNLGEADVFVTLAHGDILPQRTLMTLSDQAA